MSYRTAIYQQLASDSVLTAMLAEKPREIGIGPAIYETWAPQNAEMPYINLSFSFSPGQDLAKRTGMLLVDIFTDGYDTRTTEAIQRRIIELLDIQIINDAEDGPIRLYLANENEIPEPEESISHWNVSFTVIYFRKSFLAQFENRRA